MRPILQNLNRVIDIAVFQTREWRPLWNWKRKGVNVANCSHWKKLQFVLQFKSNWISLTLDDLMCRQTIQTSPPLHSLAIHYCHRSRQSPPRKGGLGRPQLDRPILHHLIGRRRKRRRMWIIEKGKGVTCCRGSTEWRQPWPWWQTRLCITRGTFLCMKTKVSCLAKNWRLAR